MTRKEFLKYMAVAGVVGASMNLKTLGRMFDPLKKTDKMPVLFVGHGNPMNAIVENEFTEGFKKVSSQLQKPNAILCISAHWETNGSFVTAMDKPKTIHDFGGFPKELYEVQYPAPGSPALANETKKIVSSSEVGLDDSWGLDHGTWTVVKFLYPDADVPVVQLSLDRRMNAEQHYRLSEELRSLRTKGVLIVGSGNIVHNLRMVAWDKINEVDYAYDWAEEANTKMKNAILDGDHKTLINYREQGKAFDLAIPTPEHYLPLLYSLALKDRNDEISLFNDKAVAGSLTMTSVKIG